MRQRSHFAGRAFFTLPKKFGGGDRRGISLGVLFYIAYYLFSISGGGVEPVTRPPLNTALYIVGLISEMIEVGDTKLEMVLRQHYHRLGLL